MCPSLCSLNILSHLVYGIGSCVLDDLLGDLRVDVISVFLAMCGHIILDLVGDCGGWNSNDSHLLVANGQLFGMRVFELLFSEVSVDLCTSLEFYSLLGVLLFETICDRRSDISGGGELVCHLKLLVLFVDFLFGFDDFVDGKHIGDGRVHARGDDLIHKAFGTLFANHDREGFLDTLISESRSNDGFHILNDILGDIDRRLEGVISVSIEVVAGWVAFGLARGGHLRKVSAHLDGLGSGEEASEGKVESHGIGSVEKFLFFV